MATLEVMSERGRLDPDIGYWAERWDPEGRLHPLYYTSHIGDRWVNATTLPMLYAAYPLYRLGGYRLALLLPMLGSVLAAMAARAMARRMGGGDGWAVFWALGVASPLVIYALDFWEHSLGVAAMAWAVVVLVDVVDRARPWPAAFVAGALFGLAATLRTESLVYGAVAVGLACAVLLFARRRAVTAVAAGALAFAGLVVPLALNHALEVATVGRSIRAQRAVGTASGAVSDAVSTVSAQSGAGAERLEEAAMYALSIHARLDVASYLLGLALLGLLVFAAIRASRPGDAGPAAVALAAVGALYATRFFVGFGFVPGLVAATPLAVVGLVHGWSSPPRRYVLAVALLPLPLIWATQFQGGAAPQWAGRYILLTGLLLATVGVISLAQLRPSAAKAFIGLALAVTGFGLAWLSVRSHGFGAASAALTRRGEPVLVSRLAHLAREGGAFYGEQRWLTAETDADQRFAVDVLERAGVTRFGLVAGTAAHERPEPIPGWRAVRRERVRVLPRAEVAVTTFEAD